MIILPKVLEKFFAFTQLFLYLLQVVAAAEVVEVATEAAITKAEIGMGATDEAAAAEEEEDMGKFFTHNSLSHFKKY